MNLNQEQIECVNSFRNRDGNINAHEIVKEARDKASPLHTLFDWDINRVHERYLVSRAEEIIRSCPIHWEEDKKVVLVPKYRHDPDPALHIKPP
jgi:hypothetical protein